MPLCTRGACWGAAGNDTTSACGGRVAQAESNKAEAIDKRRMPAKLPTSSNQHKVAGH